MKTVWKYRLNFYKAVSIDFQMPKGAKIVHVASERTGSVESFVSLWVEVDTEAPLQKRSFIVVGTGQERPVPAVYCGTVMVPPGLVLHLYETT